MSNSPKSDVVQYARELAHKIIIADGHIDVPMRLARTAAPDGSLTEDIAQSTDAGDFDYPRARMGGLDAPFMSIYVPASFQRSGGARAKADALIDQVESIIAAAPDKFAAATSVDAIVRNFQRGLISLPLGIENGAAIEDELANLQHFFDRGVRYVTLTHSENNLICDSSYSTMRTWNGLSPFGRQCVDEMNRLGIMIDVSHVSDETFFQVAEQSAAPFIASHSSCRHFTPGFERNMSDEMIARIADRRGIIMITFGSSFISAESRACFGARKAALAEYLQRTGSHPDSDEAMAFVADHDRANPKRFATVAQVADHIEHAIGIAGIDHVGLGSDFEGVGDSLPIGLKDVAGYPNLLAVLVERGHTDADLEKICSGNLFRVWREVESVASGQLT